MKPKEWGKLFIKFFSAIYKSWALSKDRHFTFNNESIFKIYLYRSALNGREIKPLEWASNQIIMSAENKDKNYETKGPVRIPKKISQELH